MLASILQGLLSYGCHYVLLNDCIDQSPAWKAVSFSADQEIPHMLWNQKVRYRIHNSPNLSPFWARVIYSTLFRVLSFDILQESGHRSLKFMYKSD